MWNQILRYQGDTTISTTSSRSWVVDSSGKPVMTAQQQTVEDFTYYQTDLDDRDPADGLAHSLHHPVAGAQGG
jgi:hypothetical protein